MNSADLTINPVRRTGARPLPTQPMFIRPGPGKPLVFASILALAAHLHRLRGDAGLELRPQVATYAGSDTFPIFVVNLVRPDEDCPEYAGAAFVNGLTREAFMAEIEAASCRRPRPHTPAEASGDVLVLA